MTEYSNVNTGALFKNERKETERHPDYNGTINVNGVDMWISAWLKTSKGGNRFMSLSVKPKDMQASAPAKEAAGIDPYQDDLIPF